MQRTLIQGGTIIAYDGAQHTVLKDGVVVVEGAHIAHVGPSYSGRVDRVLDAQGKVVSPGFINTHVHASIQATAIFTLDEGRRDLYSSGYLAYQPRRGQQRLHLTADEHRTIAEYSVVGLLRRGTTTFLEMGIVQGDPDVLVDVIGALGIRAYLGPGYRSANYVIEEDGRLQYEWDEEGGWEGFRRALAFIDRHHGMHDGRVQAILVPRNADTVRPDLLRESVHAQRDRRVILQIHTAQSLFEFHEIMRRHGKTPVQFLADLGMLGPATILGHCVYVTGHPDTATPGDVDLRLLAESGTSIAHSPLVYIRNGRLLHTYARYRRYGINVTIATDTFPHDIVSEMRIASYGCKVLERDYAAATAREVFESATLGGARALGREDLGRIAAGARADIVIFDLRNLRVGPVSDPIRAIVHTATGDDVDTVLVDGRIVVEGGRVPGYDERELVGKAQRIAERMWAHRWPERAAVPS